MDFLKYGWICFWSLVLVPHRLLLLLKFLNVFWYSKALHSFEALIEYFCLSDMLLQAIWAFSGSCWLLNTPQGFHHGIQFLRKSRMGLCIWFFLLHSFFSINWHFRYCCVHILSIILHVCFPVIGSWFVLVEEITLDRLESQFYQWFLEFPYNLWLLFVYFFIIGKRFWHSPFLLHVQWCLLTGFLFMAES